MCVCVCVTFVVFTDCESCTKPIFTNPGSVGAGEHGLVRGTFFVARRLEVVAVAELLWISWCVLGGAEFFLLCFFPIFTFFFERTRPAASMRLPCPIYLPTSNDITCNTHVGCFTFRSCATALGTHGGVLCNKYVFLPTTQIDSIH